MMQNMDSPSSSIDSSSVTRPILSLGLSIPATDDLESSIDHCYLKGHTRKSSFVKVYMEGIPIGRKLNLMAHHGYHDLIKTLHLMFDCNAATNTIIWAEGDKEESCQRRKQYVLTYQDQEGDWLMVGDVPWEMFLNAVTRLKITQIDRSMIK